MDFDFSIHSAFLIHWTGKDIDCLHDPHWYKNEEGKSLTNEDCTKAYIKRLHSILKYGLWMTKEQKNDLSFNGDDYPIPNIPQVCFTELKLSESRKHARQYGRLGIGVKRRFVFDRFGRPLVYYHEKRKNKDKLLKSSFEDLINANLRNFFKPMNSSDRLIYDIYSESEWRIIFFEELLGNKIFNPKDKMDKIDYESLSSEEKNKLKYLIPLDGWFSMRIYPSLDVKNKAQQDNSNGIKQQIKIIKDKYKSIEGGNWPIELDLDVCRNF